MQQKQPPSFCETDLLDDRKLECPNKPALYERLIVWPPNDLRHPCIPLSTNLRQFKESWWKVKAFFSCQVGFCLLSNLVIMPVICWPTGSHTWQRSNRAGIFSSWFVLNFEDSKLWIKCPCCKCILYTAIP